MIQTSFGYKIVNTIVVMLGILHLIRLSNRPLNCKYIFKYIKKDTHKIINFCKIVKYIYVLMN